MKVIGHRGAAGLALEDTLESLAKAVELGVDAIEFDVQLTKDKHLVLCHDADLARVSNSNQRINQLTLSQIRKVRLNNGQRPATLEEALKITGKLPVIIEVKSHGSADTLLKVLGEFPAAPVKIASFKHDEAAIIKKRAPHLKVFLAEHHRPFEILQIARAFKADGLDLNYWLLNPLTYWLARRLNLEIMVYTVNRPLTAWFLNLLYPKIAICTDFPDKLLEQREKLLKVTKK